MFAVTKLSLNLSKTSYMLFRNRPPDVDFNMFIEHERINRVHVTKFLGMGKHVCYKCGMYNGTTETSSSSNLWCKTPRSH